MWDIIFTTEYLLSASYAFIPKYKVISRDKWLHRIQNVNKCITYYTNASASVTLHCNLPLNSPVYSGGDLGNVGLQYSGILLGCLDAEWSVAQPWGTQGLGTRAPTPILAGYGICQSKGREERSPTVRLGGSCYYKSAEVCKFQVRSVVRWNQAVWFHLKSHCPILS